MNFRHQCLVAILLFAGWTSYGADELPSTNNDYSSAPKHLWNRLNQTLFERTAPDGSSYGLDELDILYWFRTRHLLVEPSHESAIKVLDEFIQSHGEKQISDPWKRARLQRDLWELFDWSTQSSWKQEDAAPRQMLQWRLALVIQRLALSSNDVAALPNNYDCSDFARLPDLPRDLLQSNGDWIPVFDRANGLTAPAHAITFHGHSVFNVFIHVPGGRAAGLKYLNTLHFFAWNHHSWVYETNQFAGDPPNGPRETMTLNPKTPQFPEGTEWALVRRMCLINSDGKIQSTHVVESVQIRRYLNPQRRIYQLSTLDDPNPPQQFYEFQMTRTPQAGLRAVGRQEAGFPFLPFGIGFDPFEPGANVSAGDPQPFDSTHIKSVVLHSCLECHSSAGIFSVNSFTRLLSFYAAMVRPADLTPGSVEDETLPTIDWKQGQFDWGMLQGLWNQND